MDGNNFIEFDPIAIAEIQCVSIRDNEFSTTKKSTTPRALKLRQSRLKNRGSKEKGQNTLTLIVMLKKTW